jgi:hypothetical protein
MCHSVINIWEQVKMIFMKNLRTQALMLTNVAAFYLLRRVIISHSNWASGEQITIVTQM